MLEHLFSRFENLPMILPGILIAIVLHELAHGYAAYLLGDPTAKERGRLTLNPIAHIDILGFLMLIFAGFGWAKPVPINPRYFKNRKLGTVLVSLAGPFTNFLIAITTVIVSTILIRHNLLTNQIVVKIIFYIILYNIVLGVFNLLPFPPLDGSKVLASLLPTKYEIMFYKYERYLYSILLILLITDSISKILNPAVVFIYEQLSNLSYYF